jgi:hypothetical protein
MAHLEGAFEQMDQRLGSVDARLGSVEGQVRDLRVEMREQFHWILGLLLVAILSPAIVRLLGH